MDFEDLKKDFFLSKEPKEIIGTQAISSLSFLLEKAATFNRNQPQVLLAPSKDLKKIKSFLSFKKTSLNHLELPMSPLSNYVFAEKNWNQRRMWQAWAQQNHPSLFLATPLSLLKKTSTKEPCLHLKKEDTLEDISFLRYLPKPFVEKAGDFSSRGFLWDIYSPAYSYPLRLELIDKKIQSIHLLSKDLKTRTSSLEEAWIPFLKEWGSDREQRQQICHTLKTSFSGENFPFMEDLLKTISRGEDPDGFESLLNLLDSTCSLDYFPTKPSLWIWNAEETMLEFEKSLEKIEEDQPLFKKEFLFLPWEKINSYPKTEVKTSSSPFLSSKIQSKKFLSKTISPSSDLQKFFSELPVSDIVFLCQTPHLETKIKQILMGNSLNKDGSSLTFKSKNLYFLQGIIEESFFSDEGSAYVQLESLFSKDTKSLEVSTFEFFRHQTKSIEFSQLKQGDLVVHRKYGIAQFEGLKTLKTQQQIQDFFLLTYRGGDKLFLPAYKAKEIKKYFKKSSFKFTPYLLDRLNDSKRWNVKKSQAKKYIQSIALDLIKLYKKRKQSFRKPFLPINKSLEKFEKEFPFEETSSQKQAIQEIFKDLDQSCPMDRLLCADVGFGKTEVALRAAFRAIESGYQVCFLAPTTLLSLQHYENFKIRFKNWPYKISLLNRFASKKEKEEIFKETKEHKVDLLIATHSALSPHLSFNNLGLLIIDEEHRFGVKQKEQLSRFKHNVDILYLSATPIPRTLNMAMSGIKDISILIEPPSQRKPIKTFLKSWSEGIEPFIKEACQFEKNRGGQILFVHNRIKTIYEKAEQLQKLLPNFKLACVHGRLPPLELENTMLDFFNKKFDVLVSTNIIESGLDIPQANTVFIDKAHQVGLSQIYQIKGRVGRGERQAYCYLLIPRKEGLSPIAKERLSLLEKHKKLGAGFHLALHDLETRGAGSVFGAEQSGHLHTLGEDLFFELLNETLEDQKEGFVEPDIKHPLSTGIPSFYIPDPKLRLFYYKNLSEATEAHQLFCLKQEFLENFGPIPEELESLFSLLKIKFLCKNLLIKDLKLTTTSMTLVFHPKTKVSLEKIIHSLQEKNWKALSEHSLKIPLEDQEDLFVQTEKILKDL